MHIFKQFLLSNRSYIQMMKNCSYHYNDYYPNLHHLEINIWEHAKSAYQIALKYKVSEYVKYAILLHDLGRIYTKKRNDKKKKVNFGHFEGVSVFVSITILQKSPLNENEIIRVLKIISYQYLLIDYIKYENPSYEQLFKIFQQEDELLKDLLEYTKCDIEGRIIDSSIVHLYKNEKTDILQNWIYKSNFQKKNLEKKTYNAYILVGPPCSRKSTWVSHKSENFFIVSRDNCEEEIGKKYGITTYDESYSFMLKNEYIRKEINQLEQQQIDEAIKIDNMDIVIDNPNMEIKKRKFWINNLKNTHNIYTIVFLTSLDTLFECNKLRSIHEKKSIKKSVVLTKLKLFHMPLLSEEVDNIEYIFNS